MTLSQKQIKSFQEATHRFNIWCGAVRSGKTYSSILKLIERIQNGPQGNVMIIGVNRDTIQRNVLLELYKFLGFPVPGTKTTETKLYGRNVYFVGAHDESAVRRIQGSTLALAYVDEATCIPAPFWRMLLSRLSVPGAQLLATCNPEGPAHWLKKEYIDRAGDLDLAHWDFTLDDNPSLDDIYKENLKKEYTGAWHNRYILGLWAVAHGLIYDGYDYDNVYEEPQNEPNYYVVGIDYGTTNATAAVLCACTPRKWPQIRVEAEYYYDSKEKGRSKADDELAQDIYEFVQYKHIQAVYVDPAAASLKIELRKKNLPVLDAKNDVIPGIKTVSKFISNKNIVIHKSCKTLLEHIQSYSWDEKAAARGEDKPLKVNDHICVTGDTQILTKYGYKRIDKLCKIKSFDIINYEYGETFFGMDIDTAKNACLTRKNANILEIELENGMKLKATPDHKVLTEGNVLKTIEDMNLSDNVFTYSKAYLDYPFEERWKDIIDGDFILSKVKSIKKVPNEDVYCLGAVNNGTMIANGIATTNCDALRYACYSAFPQGEFSNPAEELSYDQLRRYVHGDDSNIFGEHFAQF